MEKIKLGLFDVFGFIFPGLLALFAVMLPFIYDTSLKDLSSFFNQTKEVPIGLLILLGSYIVGASIHQLGYYWYYLMVMIVYYWCLRLVLSLISPYNKKAEKMLDALKEKHALLNNLRFITGSYILIRQFTPAQVVPLDEWTSKRAMSFNLSLSFFVLIFTSHTAWTATHNQVWSVVVWFSIFSTVSLLIRAYGYDFWWKKELKLIVETFELQQKKIDIVYPDKVKESD